MKNNTFFTLILVLLSSYFSFSQQLFSIHKMNIENYNQMMRAKQDLNINKVKEQTIFLSLNNDCLDSIMNNDIHNLEIELPFFNSNFFLDLTLFNVHDDLIEVKRQTIKGEVIERVKPGIKTYRVAQNQNNIVGTFVFSNKGAKAIFNLDQKTYQIALLSTKNSNNIYFMANIEDSPIKFEFSCGNGLLSQLSETIEHNNFRNGNIFGCVEIAMEIDYYTFQTFNNYQEAVDWALEIISVASTFYLLEIGVELKSNFAQIWEIDDPYANFMNDANNMLFSIRDYWNDQDDLISINRHVVHLFSRRNNTGTGGIAFLNGVGSAWNGYGFSSNLTDTEDYVDLPVPYFFWNIYCLMHELGHNFGAKHTQWCGWPDGPLDNCVNIEEVFPGECVEYENNPTAQIGTIMSYCHMWPAQSGGGIIMKFHETVKQTMIIYMGIQDLDDCDEDLITQGCMDSLACNYNIDANTDNDTCIYPELYYNCLGNCINDENENFICDEDENLSFESSKADDHAIFYPNPAVNYISVQKDNLSMSLKSLHIVNTLGQIVFFKSNINPMNNIDISTISSGSYIAYLMDDEEIIKENIIIQ